MTLLALCLATACSSGRSGHRDTLHDPEAAPASEPRSQEEAASTPEPTAPDPTPSEAPPAPRAEGYLCAHDRCPAVPPACPVGQIPSVHGEGGCYGPCVPYDECACDDADDCALIRGSTCGPSGLCIIDCNVSHARNPVRPPACPAGEVLSVIGVGWGPCVAATLCSCTTFDDCPQITGISEVCTTSGHCSPAM